MLVQLKNITTFEGTDGYGFNCSLYVDGKRTAVLHDGAYGGEIEIIKFFDEERFNSFVQEANEKKEDWMFLIWDLVSLYQIKTSTRKILIKEDGQYYTIDKLYKKAEANVITKLLKEKHPNATLINNLPIAEEI